MNIIDTPDGRALDYSGQQIPLPALAVDATIHIYDTPNGPWLGIQQPGEPRPVYAGSGGKRVGAIELEADADAIARRALGDARANAMQRINAGYEAEMNEILRQYPNAETLTWDKQEREARAYQADNTASTPYIDAIAAGRGMDKGELVARIVAKADAWVELSGAATGKRQALEDQIAAADSVESLNAIAR